MALRLDEQTMMDTVNVLLLSHPGSAEELAAIHELNPACVKISSADGPRTMNCSIAILSWRWDVLKGSSLDEMRGVVSPKVVHFIKLARKLGFKWAWCDYATVPQFAEDRNELMRHIQSSRTLYQKCTIVVVDVVEVWPGISVPTMDFQTRLWIAAEKSAVLSNPNVSLGTYVQVSRLTQMTICLLIEAPWSPATGLPMVLYSMWMDALLTKDEEAIASNCGHLRKQGALFTLVSSRGYSILQRSYPGLCAWLGVYFTLKYSQGADKILDESHEESEPPLTEEEQAALIDSYWTVVPDLSPGAAPSAVIRTPMRGEHPAVRALLSLQAGSDKMRPDFSVTANYKGFLLLASEVAYAYMAEQKFDPAVYENLMINLGQHPTTPAPPEDAPYALKAFMRSDFEVVKNMILADSGITEFPCTFGDLEMPKIPFGHKVSVSLMPEIPFAKLVLEGLQLNAINYASKPEGIAWKVMVSVNEAAGACYMSLTIEGASVTITASEAGMPNAVVSFSANDGLEKTREMGEYTLGNEEAFIILSANMSDMADYSKSKNAMLFVPASNVTTETVRSLVRLAIAFSKSGALVKEPVPKLTELLKQMLGGSGMVPNYAALDQTGVKEEPKTKTAAASPAPAKVKGSLFGKLFGKK
ncbi:hypothetical protein T492DRAFT_1054931 [Pavlovales sp. CCMP2436]|nr:hypothetical protein T492DRAFT_1054931 [Pavlovales sp. CCMP2436]